MKELVVLVLVTATELVAAVDTEVETQDMTTMVIIMKVIVTVEVEDIRPMEAMKNMEVTEIMVMETTIKMMK